MYLWMNDILMVTLTPRGGMVWTNILFSRDLQRLILMKDSIDLFLNEAHPNSNLCPKGLGGIKK